MALKIENLSKGFDNKVVFNQFSYQFSKKGIYILVGESGVGKTTLLRMIAGLDNEFEGSIVGNKTVSFAFQEYRLFPHLSALDNIIFAISDKKTEAVTHKCKNMLIRLGLTEHDMKLLPGELSGGMKQRVSLARAFLAEGDILLLDEPTKELDQRNADIVKEIIAEQSKERIVIMVSHVIHDLKLRDAKVIHIE